jgi:hypothetical protein
MTKLMQMLKNSVDEKVLDESLSYCVDTWESYDGPGYISVQNSYMYWLRAYRNPLVFGLAGGPSVQDDHANLVVKAYLCPLEDLPLMAADTGGPGVVPWHCHIARWRLQNINEPGA